MRSARAARAVLARACPPQVLLQFTLFYPGLALFTEFVALGNEYSRMASEQAERTSQHLSESGKSIVRRVSTQVSSSVVPATTTNQM